MPDRTLVLIKPDGVRRGLIGSVISRLEDRGLRIALVTGSILQLLLIAAGALVPVMYGLGVIFGALWTVAILLGRSAERADPR